jgi:predicted HD phosphohydrolase
MKAAAAYQHYNIMPTLAQHMLQVGAVAKIVTDQINEPDFPATQIISACLLHDMGNIMKFDLDNVPVGLDIPDIDHWKSVQADIRNQYGLDEHQVTHHIASEIGVSSTTLSAIENCGTSKAASVLADQNIPAMFVTYCDYHVAPASIVSPAQRLADILDRYAGTPKHAGYQADSQNVLALADYLETTYNLDPGLVTAEAVAGVVESLKDWDLV